VSDFDEEMPLDVMREKLRAASGKGPSRKKALREPVTSINKVLSDRERKNSRVKGSTFELAVAKAWAKWSGEHVRRTPQSGGWSNAKFGVTADLVCDAKRWPFHIECFTGDTLVLTIDGYRPISTINIGDKVMTHTGHWRRVTGVMTKPNAHVDEFWSVASTEHLHVTRLHPLEQFDGSFTASRVAEHTSHLTRWVQHSVSEKRWLYPSQTPKPPKVKAGFCLCGCGGKLKASLIKGQPRRFITGHNGGLGLRTELPKKVSLDEDLAYLIGLYIAEGHCSKDKVTWTFHRDETLLHSAVDSIVSSKFCVATSIGHSKTTKACRVTACSTNLSKTFMEWCGTGSRRKRLGWLIGLRDSLAWALIRGLFQGDGHVRTHVASYASKSKVLAYDIQALLFRLGVVSYAGVNKRGLYKINVAMRDLTMFGEAAGLVCRSPNTARQYDHTFIRDIAAHRVYFRNPERRCNMRATKVWNLSVEIDETFVVQGNLVVHNCKSREGAYVEDLITGVRVTDTRSIRAWWQQTIRSCPKNKTPVLVWKRNHLKPLVMVRRSDWLIMARLQDSFVSEFVNTIQISIDDGELVMISQETFHAVVRYNKKMRMALKRNR
jgi:hypothetical protein